VAVVTKCELPSGSSFGLLAVRCAARYPDDEILMRPVGDSPYGFSKTIECEASSKRKKERSAQALSSWSRTAVMSGILGPRDRRGAKEILIMVNMHSKEFVDST
jgi:hypothetical protein